MSDSETSFLRGLVHLLVRNLVDRELDRSAPPPVDAPARRVPTVADDGTYWWRKLGVACRPRPFFIGVGLSGEPYWIDDQTTHGVKDDGLWVAPCPYPPEKKEEKP